MKRNFVVLGATIALVGTMALAGCSSSSGSQANTSGVGSDSGSGAEPQSAAAAEELTLGSTFDFDNMTIKIGEGYETTTLSNQFSEHDGQTVIALPVSATNNDSEAKGLNMFYVKEFGSQGTELDNCFTYFDDDIRMAGEARPGATLNAKLYFLYDGNGDYYLSFDNISSKSEVKVPVTI